MHVQDVSAALPHDKRQIFDCLVREAAQIIQSRQQADLTNTMARPPKRPVGDRHRVTFERQGVCQPLSRSQVLREAAASGKRLILDRVDADV